MHGKLRCVVVSRYFLLSVGYLEKKQKHGPVQLQYHKIIDLNQINVSLQHHCNLLLTENNLSNYQFM